jgi:hypothetical protein
LISDIGFIRVIPDAATPSAEPEGLKHRIIPVVSFSSVLAVLILSVRVTYSRNFRIRRTKRISEGVVRRVSDVAVSFGQLTDGQWGRTLTAH